MNSKLNIRNNPFQIGFIGGGIDSAIGEVHLIASQMDGLWKLAAGCFSKDSALNNAAGDAYGISSKRVYPDWQELLEKEKGKLDAIVVLTPIPDHHLIIEKCFEYGFPVISEKALSNSFLNAQAILNAQRKNNHFLAVTYNYSAYPMVREMRCLVEEGAIGKLLHFQVEMPQEGYLRVNANGEYIRPQAWRLADGSIPTVYLDLAAHLYQLTHYLFAEKPQSVIADHAGFGNFDVIDNATILCKYASGVKGSMWFGKSSLGYRNGLRIRIFGSTASLDWVQTNPEELTVCRADGSRTIFDRSNNLAAVSNQKRYNRFKSGHPSGYIEAFANLYVDLAQCLIQYQSTGSWESNEIATPELDCAFLQFCDAAIQSVSTGRWEQVDQRPSPSENNKA